VNLLGAHVDYHDGWVLPGAIDRSVWLAAASRDDRRLRGYSLSLDEGGCLELPPPGRLRASGRLRHDWLDYVLGVAWALEYSGRTVPALDLVVGGDLPVGAGVSSSAALEMALLYAWRALAGFELDTMEAARLGRSVENDYLDVQSGIMDQFASLHGREGHVMLLDCRHLEWELLELPQGVAVLIADSGVRRRLVEGGINDRRQEGTEALQILRGDDPDLVALRDVPQQCLETLETRMRARLARRVRHVVEECARVRRGAELLRDGGDPAALGALMSASHRSSRDLYEVSIDELDVLTEAAWGCAGCFGARLSGAGFGGCVTALVDAAAVDAVAATLVDAFRRRFEREPELLRCHIGDGAEVVDPAS
ncbi:MAG: galactokinase, partial [Thermoanaerobaculia bacterium]|nr:galactokinase [Thermoanaerobaculia bacterium]